jgi:lipopolysaccharide heptosyltransferase II
MGDVIMSGPAIRALKNSFHARITLLTSRMGSIIAPHLPEIDEVITADLPWVQTDSQPSASDLIVLAEKLRSLKYDLAVIFTVYSQSALPAAMLAFLAGIPRRLAYCRENPYHLLTDWVPDKEPYSCILHQVQRDLKLVEAIGARQLDDRLRISCSEAAKRTALQKAAACGIDRQKPWIILHPGVSDQKRAYPVERWQALLTALHQQLGLQLVISGSAKDAPLAEEIRQGFDFPVYSVAGALDMDEFIALLSMTTLIISVNTGTAHIAAALNRPLVVLYARTNPQHTPWKGRAEVLFFSGDPLQSSRNEVIRWVNQKVYLRTIDFPGPDKVLDAIKRILRLPAAKVVKM